ncbi:MAG TPA: hypothetical protein VGR11_16040 [Solirubrobacteraceae bacterium]|nr:hypothetical protein [Solirubrobacteraceae bacterium]
MGDGGGHLLAQGLRLTAAAGLASIAAGTIHAAAAAAHADHAPAEALFAILAAGQIGWGLLALRPIGRRLILAGAVGNLVVLAAWLTAKTAGIGFVRGLEHAERAQLSDSLAAAMAAFAAVGAFQAVAGAGRRAALGTPVAGVVAVVIAAAAVAGVMAARGHAHGEPGYVASARHDAAELQHAPRRTTPHAPGATDLGGVEGVTAAQQARAERLRDATRRRLPVFARVAAAEAAGYVSIGDAVTGHEHYVNWSYVNDDAILDPAHAESLVYRVDGRERTLVAAMYMLGEDAKLDTVPDVGGRLTQWHVHDDLCFTDDDAAPVVAGLTTPGGRCPPPLVKRARVPMLHVWIVPHECGPFAALDGVAGGQVEDGERPRCHHVHAGS